MSKRTVMTAHGLTTKFAPLLFVIPAFMIISDYTRETIAFIDPVDLFIAVSVGLGGLLFLYETLYSYYDNKNGSSIGHVGWMIFAIISFVNFAFAGSIFWGLYDPTTDRGDANLVLQVFFLGDIILMALGGLYEIFLAKHFTLRRLTM